MSKVKLLITDVDGVLTDGGMYYSENGDELKKFNTRDGKGVEILRELGVIVAIITSEDNNMNLKRAQKLKIKYVFQNVKDKLQCASKLLGDLDLNYSEVAYIGDDINDINLLKAVEYSFCPMDAMDNVKKICKFIMNKKGGEGVLREVVEIMIKEKHVSL